MIKNRYLRNKILCEEEQQLLKKSNVIIFGTGGLGGFVAEGLARMGVGKLILVDIDVFSETNLNRQRFSYENNIGKSKVAEAENELKKINSEISIATIDKKLNDEEIINIVKKECINLVIDCLDSKKDKLSLETICAKSEVTLIHGAISGWFGQVATIYPHDDLLKMIYEGKEDKEDEFGNPSFTPICIAGFQISEAIKYLTNKTIEHGKLLTIDLKNNEMMKC